MLVARGNSASVPQVAGTASSGTNGNENQTAHGRLNSTTDATWSRPKYRAHSAQDGVKNA